MSQTTRTSTLLIPTLAAAAATASLLYYHYCRNARSPSERSSLNLLDNEIETKEAPLREIRVDQEKSSATKQQSRILKRNCITIVHGSVTGTCAKFAASLLDKLTQAGVSANVQMGPVDDWDWWDELLNDEEEEEQDGKKAKLEQAPLVVLFLPTYTEGSWPPSSNALQSALHELQTDWRIAKFPLKGKLRVAVFGMGSSEYDAATMGKPAKEAVRAFQKLGAKSMVHVQIGDDAVGNHAKEAFHQWESDLMNEVKKYWGVSSCACGESKQSETCCQGNDNLGNETADDADGEDESDDDENREPEIVDLEDMGDAILASKRSSPEEPREMVTPSQAAALKKEGYKLIGTHSAVKLCRWTKHQLRGRGGCYKHTFYGITSYQCMEATPSLACANKCVFCWRHHKNPVGKEWRWKTDDPHFIVEEAVQAHIKMIKEARGIPGVRMDRWQEALTVRHCALSLVGEPIMYPRIDEFLADLHTRKISTFLVTNGQHPSAIASIRPITQLYVSVDAPTKESLIEIDRPLFRDAWERLRESLSSLKSKGQRTVARLTVVKGWNSEEIEGYANLIALGHVSLVEIKGVTFCGKSDASNLNMTNTPWHHEVVALAKTLKDEIDKIRNSGGLDVPPEYDFACEHKHSCSVLLARVDQFAVDDPVTGRRRWRTWIDYDKFQELAARNAANPSFSFTVEDYTADTPEWALFGSEAEGFDPTDARHRKKTKYPMYTHFDEKGIPTHDHDNVELSEQERSRLRDMMENRIREIGAGSTVTELRDGAKEIFDASLMFRGMVIAK